MIPVTQTDTSFRVGDCGAACLASILEIPLEDIPQFRNPKNRLDGEYYCAKVREFLAPYGLGYIDITMSEGHDPKEFFKNCWIVATGPSPRGTEEWHQHAVVWRNGEIVWDPHPSRAGLPRIDLYGLLIAQDPALYALFCQCLH